MRPLWAQQAGGLEPTVFRRYLAATGWRCTERRKAWRYTRASEVGDVTVEVPKTRQYADYERRVVEVIEILAAVEQRADSRILFDLENPTVDTVAFRFASPQIQSGTLALNDVCRIHDAQRRLLLSAAHSVLEPLSHHPRLSKAEAVGFLDSCKSAPPQAGSYLTPVLIPVTSSVGQLDLADPFSRRVTRLLATALHQASEALDSGQDARLLEEARSGLSSNFLGAFSDLRPPGQGFVEITFSWSPGRPAPGAPRLMRFGHTVFDAIGEAARVLRETTPVPGTTVEGYFANLKRAAQDASVPGDATLLAELEDRQGSTKVHMTLSADAYQDALDAHGNAARVRVTGTLVKNGRRYELQNPGDIVRIADDID